MMYTRLVGRDATRNANTKTVHTGDLQSAMMKSNRAFKTTHRSWRSPKHYSTARCHFHKLQWCQKQESKLPHSQRRKGLDSMSWDTTRGRIFKLTKSAEDCICKSITNWKFPLRGYEKTQRCSKEEIRNIDICDHNTSPFHQTQGERSKSCAKNANCKCRLL